MSRLAAVAVLGCALLVLSAGAQEPPPVKNNSTSQTTSAAPPQNPRQAAELRGDILMAQKMYPEAIVAYQKLLKDDPHNSMLLNKVGVAYQQEGRSDKAGRYYKDAVKADKKNASALNNLGSIEYEKNNYRRAIRYYKQALAVRTDMAVIYSNLGYAYFADKKYPDAMDSFERALALDPQVFEHRGSGGTVVQQRSITEPGLFYFLVAKTFALSGDAERTAHYLKMARDEGYKDIVSAQKDPDFKKVLSDPRVQDILQNPTPSVADGAKPSPKQ
jgi:tetratricopeptide (TPR) repeat protein